MFELTIEKIKTMIEDAWINGHIHGVDEGKYTDKTHRECHQYITEKLTSLFTDEETKNSCT